MSMGSGSMVNQNKYIDNCCLYWGSEVLTYLRLRIVTLPDYIPDGLSAMLVTTMYKQYLAAYTTMPVTKWHKYLAKEGTARFISALFYDKYP